MLNIFGRLIIMSGKEEDMMAMLWAQQIMLGKKTYAQVPRLLKDKVKEVLSDSGCEDLVTE
jgi:hypothetical protein